MSKRRMILLHVSACVILGILTGCAGPVIKNMGSFEPSAAAADHFEKFTVNKDYDYFLSGSDVYPVAIFALKKEHPIAGDPDLWKKIDPTRTAIPELVGNMQRRTMECCFQGLHGFDILDHQGGKIGQWYSMIGFTTGIQMKEDGKVVIYPPSDTPSLKRYQGRTDERH